jgi:hypothetical protein
VTATGQAFEVTEQALLHTLTRVVNTLQQNGIKFAVAGVCAVYARGGPPSDHDVDVHLKESDAEAATQALVEAGMRPVDPPEDWLTKVYDGDLLVDLIFTPNRRPVTDVELDRAEMLRIGPAEAPVVTGTDLLSWTSFWSSGPTGVTSRRSSRSRESCASEWNGRRSPRGQAARRTPPRSWRCCGSWTS